jgi:hypothetical protein
VFQCPTEIGIAIFVSCKNKFKDVPLVKFTIIAQKLANQMTGRYIRNSAVH